MFKRTKEKEEPIGHWEKMEPIPINTLDDIKRKAAEAVEDSHCSFCNAVTKPVGFSRLSIEPQQWTNNGNFFFDLYLVVPTQCLACGKRNEEKVHLWES